MAYRYRFHWYVDAGAPLTGGRALLGRTQDVALSEAESLWSEGAYPAALGYVVVDTEDGTVVRRRERDPMAARPPGVLLRSR